MLHILYSATFTADNKAAKLFIIALQTNTF